MRFHACRKLLRDVPDAHPGDCRNRSSRCTLGATDSDRQILLAVQAQFERQFRWSRRSQTVGQVLGIAAVAAMFAAAQPLIRGVCLAAAIIELGLMPWYLATVCRRLRRIVALIAKDVDGGVVRSGRGQVRSLVGNWRVIQDLRTGALAFASARLIGLADLRPGERALYRYAPNSRVVLGLEGQEPGFCEVVPDEGCQADAFILSCSPARRKCSPNVDDSALLRVMPELEANYAV